MTDSTESIKDPTPLLASFDDFQAAELSNVLLDIVFADDDAFAEALYVAKKNDRDGR